jgi:hypothetical protein
MRGLMPMIVLKARVEAAQGNYPAAIRTLATGFSFSRQVGDGPFLINGLVGIAIANFMSGTVPDLIERPDAPNLYWALATIPRPLIDLRRAEEIEQNIVELQFPELADLDRTRTAEQWDALLVAVRKASRLLAEMSGGPKPSTAGPAVEDRASKSPDLPSAKKYLTDRAGMKAQEVDAMPASRVLLLWIVRYARELFDDQYKSAYLPYAEARSASNAAAQRLNSAPDTEGRRFGTIFLAAVSKVIDAQARLERSLAALRVIEAIRMHAAGNGGQLPNRLDQVTEVPVPDDPGTGKPFEYVRDGATATLSSRIAGESLARTGIRYKLTIRK